MNNYLNLLANSIVMDCDSWQFKYKECTVTGIGHAVDIALQNQRSKIPCVKDENYGVSSGTEIWVDNGCRGAFIVSLCKCIMMLQIMAKHKLYFWFYSISKYIPYLCFRLMCSLLSRNMSWCRETFKPWNRRWWLWFCWWL